jgi:hypothetical protein
MPLVLRSASIYRPSGHWGEDVYDIVLGGLVIGRLVQEGVGRGQQWRWYVHGIVAPATGNVRLSGHAADLEQAKAAIAHNWEKWLALAKLKEID